MEESKGGQELDSSLTVCDVCCVVRQKSVSLLVGSPALPFIDQGGAGVYRWKKEEKKPTVEVALQRCQAFLFP